MSAKAQDQWTELAQRGSEAWPDLALDASTFVAYLRQRISEDELLKPDRAAQIHVADLYLACACAQGDDAALRAFEKRYAAVFDAVVKRFQSSGTAADDIRQQLWIKLFVGQQDAPPKITQYNGLGHLENWLRVTAVRAFLDRTRGGEAKQERDKVDLPSFSGVIAEADPELAFLKTHYRQAFKVAFAAAVASLSTRDRNLLRQQVLWGLNVDQIGAVYHIHRSTAARRLVKARQTLLEATRSQLAKHLDVGEAEVNSIIQLIQSRMDVSLVRVFKEQGK